MDSTSPSNEQGQTPLEELSYEQAFTELESIVSTLESDQRSLEEILALFERGQLLARYCSRMLDQADLKVQELNGENLVDFTAQP